LNPAREKTLAAIVEKPRGFNLNNVDMRRF